MVKQQKAISVRTTLEVPYSAQKMQSVLPLLDTKQSFEHISVVYWGVEKKKCAADPQSLWEESIAIWGYFSTQLGYKSNPQRPGGHSESQKHRTPRTKARCLSSCRCHSMVGWDRETCSSAKHACGDTER